MAKKKQIKTRNYVVSFQLTVEGDETTETIEEAVTAMVDAELADHRGGATRCGVRFDDAAMFSVVEGER